MKWLRRILRRRKDEADLDAEVRSYMDLLADEKERAGDVDAHRSASIEAGGVDQIKEAVRDVRPGVWIEQIGRDIRYSLRALRNTPSFTIAAVVTLALGIGASTVVYSVVHTVLIRPLPIAEPERLVRIIDTNPPLAIENFTSSMPNFVSWRERARSFSDLVAVDGASVNLTGSGEALRVEAARITASFFQALGISMRTGRPFMAGEDRPGASRSIIISEGLWRRRFASDPAILGRQIEIDGESRTIVGVAPQDIGMASATDLWLPLDRDPARENRSNHYLRVFGRLAPGVTIEQASAEMGRITADLEREFPDHNRGWRARLLPVFHWIVNDRTRQAMLTLLVAAGLLLLVACANIAGLLIARATARIHELGVRLALGAGMGRLARQMVIESLVLASIGGACGVALAYGGIAALRGALPPGLPRMHALAVDGSVLLTAVVMTVLTGLLFGLAPILVARRVDPMTSIKQAGRAATGHGRVRARQWLVAGQVAVAAVLVSGALLLLLSFQRLNAAARGFDSSGVLTARITLSRTAYASGETALAFYDNVLGRIRALPGVDSAGMASGMPLAGDGTEMRLSRTDEDAESFQVQWRIATGGYFTALRIPLRKGRLFVADEPGKPFPMILSEGSARRLWPGGDDPVGRQVRLGGSFYRVVGVVGDVRQTGLAEPPALAVYLPTSWNLWPTMALAIRTTGDPASFAPSLRRAVREIDSRQPLFDVRTLDDITDAAAATPRLNAWLLGGFAIVALVLGAVGTGGVVAYSASRRRAEMALRLALGATPRRVVSIIAADGLRYCLAGIAVGLLGGYWAGKGMEHLLFGVEGGEWMVHAASAGTMLLTAAVACWLPAIRTASIDPASALRDG